MLDFSHRSAIKELLDGDDIPWEDIQQNLKELQFINTYLGGHKIILEGVSKFMANSLFRIAEIGSGGGDNLNAIKKYLAMLNTETKLIGIDIKKDCILYSQARETDFELICSDYKKVYFNTKPDILFSSLFCHHFSEEELVEQILWMKKNSLRGFFISDLHRHPVAYYCIKWFSKLFSKSYLIKNDAPLSVARGFIKEDWKKIFEKAGIRNYTIEWKWAFRYLITVKHD